MRILPSDTKHERRKNWLKFVKSVFLTSVVFFSVLEKKTQTFINGQSAACLSETKQCQSDGHTFVPLTIEN